MLLQASILGCHDISLVIRGIGHSCPKIAINFKCLYLSDIFADWRKIFVLQLQIPRFRSVKASIIFDHTVFEIFAKAILGFDPDMSGLLHHSWCNTSYHLTVIFMTPASAGLKYQILLYNKINFQAFQKIFKLNFDSTSIFCDVI